MTRKIGQELECERELIASWKKIGQNIRANPRSFKMDRLAEQLFFSALRIEQPKPNGSGTSVGSGVLIDTPVNDEENHRATLALSNHHVLCRPKRPVKINFHRWNDDGSGPDLQRIVVYKSNNYGKCHVTHPSADISAINLSTIAYPQTKIYYRCLSPSQIADFTEPDLSPGMPVIYIGYPDNQRDLAHETPILRRGYIASIPTLDFNDEPVFAIDGEFFKGCSGSPVLGELDGELKLLGIVSERMLTHPHGCDDPESLGLGIAVKATKVRELLDLATQSIREMLAIDSR